MADNLTIVDVFEEILQVPFEVRSIHGLDIPTLRKLAFRLQSFFENFKIPAKADGELRPLLYSRYTPTQGLNRDFFHE